MTFTLTPLSDALGAEITGIDLAGTLDDDIFGRIVHAFHAHQIIVFRDQELTPEQQIAFSRRFGDLEIHISREYLHDDHPEILLVSNRQVNGEYVGLAQAGKDWHSDLSYLEKPSMGSLLHALEVPQAGGDTEWANMYTAYETLAEDTKRRIAGLKAIHSFDRRRNPRVDLPMQHENNPDSAYERSPDDVYHPMVRTHPDTGRKALFVSPRFTIGIQDMEDSEAQELLDELFEHVIQPEFIYRHKWRLGDLMFWDNRCTIHLACGGIKPPGVRHMHRTTVAGDAPY
jgi:taurine dioxygenase